MRPLCRYFELILLQEQQTWLLFRYKCNMILGSPFERMELMASVTISARKTQTVWFLPDLAFFFFFLIRNGFPLLPGYCGCLRRCVCIAKHLLQEAAPVSQMQIFLRAFTPWLGNWHTIPFSVTDSSAVILCHGLGIRGVSKYYVIAPEWRQHPLRTQLLNL